MNKSLSLAQHSLTAMEEAALMWLVTESDILSTVASSNATC